MDYIGILDDVLYALILHSESEEGTLYIRRKGLIKIYGLEYDHQLITSVLKKIEKDGYAWTEGLPDEIIINEKIRTYHISFEGNLFYENGGYAIAKERDTELHQKTRLHNRIVRVGAVAGAIVGAYYLILLAEKILALFSLYDCTCCS